MALLFFHVGYMHKQLVGYEYRILHRMTLFYLAATDVEYLLIIKHLVVGCSATLKHRFEMAVVYNYQ